MNLYEIAQEIRVALDALEAADEGDASSEKEAALIAGIEALEASAEEKVGWIVKLIKEQEAAAEAAKLEAQRVQRFAKAREGRADSLRRWLTGFLQTADMRKVVTDIATVSLRAPSKRLDVDLSKVYEWPAEVFEAAVTERPEVNKTILKTLPDFLKLPGVQEIEGEHSVTIR